MKAHHIAIASDHRGYLLKKEIVKYIMDLEISVRDLGVHNNKDSVDYPDYADFVVDVIENDEADLGILICDTGIGMSIAANRRSTIRAALCTDEFMAKKSRLHNNANVLVLGSKLVNNDLAIKIVESFLSTKFEGGRHISRLKKIS
ncbi:MAG: ribose 5-phosphate isomerase B [Rickettsiaceae bacterium]